MSHDGPAGELSRLRPGESVSITTGRFAGRRLVAFVLGNRCGASSRPCCDDGFGASVRTRLARGKKKNTSRTGPETSLTRHCGDFASSRTARENKHRRHNIIISRRAMTHKHTHTHTAVDVVVCVGFINIHITSLSFADSIRVKHTLCNTECRRRDENYRVYVEIAL